MSDAKESIACKLWKANSSAIHRQGSKHTVIETDFENLDYFPFRYCWGFFAIVSRPLVTPLLQAARQVPFFWIDDVFLYGILPFVMNNIKFYDIGENMTAYYAPAIRCLRQKRRKCEYFVLKAGHRDANYTKDFYSMWSILSAK